MNITKLIAVVLAALVFVNPLLASPGGMNLLGVSQETTPIAAAAQPGTMTTGLAQPAPRAEPSFWERAGDWLGKFGRSFVSGAINAIPNLWAAIKENPVKTLGMIGGMIALGVICPPAALALGGGLLAKAAWDTGGDPEKLGNLAGETAFWTALGAGGARALARRPGPVSPRMQANMDILRQTGGCFVAGTLVLTAAGFKPIEAVTVDDVVVAFAHEAAVVAQAEDVDAGVEIAAATVSDEVRSIAAARAERAERARGPHTVLRPVVTVFRHQAKALVKLTLVAKDRGTWTIEGTPNHPFYVPATDSYQPMEAIAAGTHLRAADGSDVAVVAREVRTASVPVYNIEVAGAHTYHVAAAGAPAVLVHNMCSAQLPRYNGPKPLYENAGQHGGTITGPNRVTAATGSRPVGTQRTANAGRRNAGSASEIPSNAEALYRNAIPNKDGTSWYAVDSSNVVHRFQGATRNVNGQQTQVVHWNGSTATPRGIEIPPEVAARIRAGQIRIVQ